VLAGTLTLLASGCTASGSTAAAQSSSTVQPASSATASSHARSSSGAQPASSASPGVVARTKSACSKLSTPPGDIYVRMIQVGQAAVAQQLGGEWVWNAKLDKCLTSMQMVIAAAPQIPGTCTQVGYVADNPGYNPNAKVAAPLKHVAAQAGPAC
jgi:hypothetical protein